MYRKVLAISHSIDDKTFKPKYAQITLDAIAKEALKRGDMQIKEQADKCFAMIPLVDNKDNDICDELEDLAFYLAKPTIELLEKKLCDMFGYDFEKRIELEDKGIMIPYFTPNGNIYVVLHAHYDKLFNEFQTNVVSFLKSTPDGTELKTVRIHDWKNVMLLHAIEAAIDITLA